MAPLGGRPPSVAPWYEGVIVNDPGRTTRSYNSTTATAMNSEGEYIVWTQYPGFAAFDVTLDFCFTYTRNLTFSKS